MKGQATPYLTFGGNAKEALDFYKEVFSADITDFKTFGEADYPTPPEADERVMHARIKKGDLLLMVSDSFGDSVTIGSNISLALELESEDEILQVYDQLSQGGSVFMELQDTFWGAKYAKVKDRFGIIWDLNYTKA
ncbi:VOC family protein [Camelliibacillus cellulosilyticus]|uniref:VOC family protein n=1 Tax=Camelliibacillus cellulosilyticus TaxID=2174486 RepID=A0ABV9GQJ0_9BACL